MILTVHVRPNSKENSIEWLDADTCKVKIKAPAKQGKANRELINFLSKELGLRKSEIKIVRGFSVKIKQLEIPDRTARAA